MTGSACALLGGLAVAGCSSSKPSADPSALLQKSRVASTAAGSVSFQDVSQAGKLVQTVTGAVSATAAHESLRQTLGGAGIDVILNNGVIYFRGGAKSLAHTLGLPAQSALNHAGGWIAIHEGDTPYKTIAATLTLSAQIDPFFPVAPGLTTLANRSLHGKTTTPVQGTAPASSSGGRVTMFIEPTDSLPVGATLTSKAGTQRIDEVIAFRSWGAPVSTTAPSGAVDYRAALKG